MCWDTVCVIYMVYIHTWCIYMHISYRKSSDRNPRFYLFFALREETIQNPARADVLLGM